MTIDLPFPINQLSPVSDPSKSSPIRKVMKMIEQSDDLISLAAGEAKFSPPSALIDTACAAMKTGKNIYTSTAGIPPIRAALSQFITTHFGAKVDPDTNILITVGGMEAIYLAVRVLLKAEDTVLLPDPGWGVMIPVVEKCGAKVEFYPQIETQTWTIDHSKILERIDGQTKLIVINSPSNPTGAKLSQEGFSKVMGKARELGIFVMSDEVYHNFIFDGCHESALQFNTLDNLIVINSFSKTYAVTGWRIGYVIAHEWIIEQMVMYKESTSLCSFSIGQWALADYINSSQNYLDEAANLCRRNMEMIVQRLSAIPGVHCSPAQGGFYLFPDFSEIEPSSEKIFARLLDFGVAVIPGKFFGSQGEGRVRIMFAADTDYIDRALTRLEAALS
jgi:aspartate/methionine/tyrosine aminotransferase